jgi:hypothetical protein
LDDLRAAARDCGAGAVTEHFSPRADQVRIGFATSSDAADFRIRAIEICSVLVEPELPAPGSCKCGCGAKPEPKPKVTSGPTRRPSKKQHQ